MSPFENMNLAFLHNHLMLASIFGRGYLVFDPTDRLVKVYEVSYLENPLLRGAVDYDGDGVERFTWKAVLLGRSQMALRQVNGSVEVSFNDLAGCNGRKREFGWKTNFYDVRDDIISGAGAVDDIAGPLEARWVSFVACLRKTFPIVEAAP
jgi:hypothetical protein